MACVCLCCQITGACCKGDACTQETCQNCESDGGVWHGGVCGEGDVYRCGCCVIGGSIDPSHTTEAGCEECTPATYNCYEFVEKVDGECPPGSVLADGDPDVCIATSVVSNCAECYGVFCEEATPASGPCGTWTSPCGVCCMPGEEEYTCTQEYATRRTCEAAGGIWRDGFPSCSGSPCADCGVPTSVVGGGWFIPGTEADLEALAIAAGWDGVTFTYPNIAGAYCPDEPSGICPGPYTDECGQVWTVATFHTTRVVCEFCGTESTPQFGFATSGGTPVGGNYWPSVSIDNDPPCEDLIVVELTGVPFTIPKLCDDPPP